MHEHPSNPEAERYRAQAAELAVRINELIDQRARLDATITALQREQLAAIELEIKALEADERPQLEHMVGLARLLPPDEVHRIWEAV